MDAEARLHLVGFSHRTTPVELRERYSVSPSDLASVYRTLSSMPDVVEAFVLSTCNRTEVLALGRGDRELGPELAQALFRNLDAEKHLYQYKSLDALIHVFRVAGGLDSMILGESEVLAQFRRGFEVGKETGTIGSELGPLLTHALVVGKRVRTDTGLGLGTLSVARVGVDMAARVFHRFDSCRALVVGAGETGSLVARHLVDRKVAKLSFCNRTVSRAEEAAQEFSSKGIPCEGKGLEHLPELLRKSDLVICAVDADSHTLTKEHLDARGITRRDRPFVVIDLSVPRAVASEVARLENVLLYDLDDLGRVVEENRESRQQAIEDSDRLVVQEMHKFLSLRTFRAFSPVIAQMGERFHEVRDEVLDLVAGEKTSPDQVQLAHELTKRLLDVALGQMKESARRTRSTRTLEGEYQRFLENL